MPEKICLGEAGSAFARDSSTKRGRLVNSLKNCECCNKSLLLWVISWLLQKEADTCQFSFNHSCCSKSYHGQIMSWLEQKEANLSTFCMVAKRGVGIGTISLLQCITSWVNEKDLFAFLLFHTFVCYIVVKLTMSTISHLFYLLFKHNTKRGVCVNCWTDHWFSL